MTYLIAVLGLVFNKLADSCDYPRNVVCPKAKPSTTTTTTQRTTTEELVEEEDEEEVEEEIYEDEEEIKEVENRKITDEKPKKTTTTTARTLLYKTINRSRPASSTTPTPRVTTTIESLPASNLEKLVEDIPEEEQDPRVIKELIELIKKAGTYY